MPVEEDLQSIGYDEVVRGQMSDSDPESNDYYGNYEPVTFSGGAGDEIEMTMRPEDDSRLMLVDPERNVVAENDDNYHIEDWTEEGGQFEDADDIDISQSDSTAVITGAIDTDDLNN